MKNTPQNCPYKRGKDCAYHSFGCNPKSYKCKFNQKDYAVSAPPSKETIQRRTTIPSTATLPSGVKTIDMSDKCPTLYVYRGELMIPKRYCTEYLILLSDIITNQKHTILATYNSHRDVYYVAYNLLNTLPYKNYHLKVVYNYASNIECTEPFASDELREQSILRMYGYQAGITNGLPENDRQNILTHVIENKIMTPHEIISFLNFLISFHESKKFAVLDWKHDIEFIHKYTQNEYIQELYRQGILKSAEEDLHLK